MVTSIFEAPFSGETPLRQHALSLTVQALEESCDLQHRRQISEVSLPLPPTVQAPAGVPGCHSFSAPPGSNLCFKGSLLPIEARYHLLSPGPLPVPWVCHYLGTGGICPRTCG